MSVLLYYTLFRRLIRQLYERDYERQKVLDLFRFIDWVMRLPEDLEDRFWNEHEQYARRSIG